MQGCVNIIEAASGLLKWAESAGANKDSRFVVVPLFGGKPEESYDMKGSACLIDSEIIINGMEDVKVFYYRNFSEINVLLSPLDKQQRFSEVIGTSHFNEQFLLETFVRWSRKYPVKGVAVVADNMDEWHSYDAAGGHIVAYVHNDFKTSAAFPVSRIDFHCNDKGQIKSKVFVAQPGEEAHDCILPDDGIGFLVKKHIAVGSSLLVSRKFGSWKYIDTLCLSVTGDNSLLDNVEHCPFCGSKTAWDGSLSELYCTNEDCDGRQKIAMHRFFGAFGMSDDDIAKLHNAGFNRIEKILQMSAADIREVFGEAADDTELLINEIKTNPNLFKLAKASGCFDVVGEQRFAEIINSFDDETLNDFCNAWYNPLFDVRSFRGGQISRLLYDFASGVKPFHEFAERYNLPVPLPRPLSDDWKGKFAGKTIAFSGLNRSMNKVIRKMVKMENGTIVGNVTRKTSMLVYGKPKTRTKRVMDARFYLVPLIHLSKFVINLRYKKHYEKHKTSE